MKTLSKEIDGNPHKLSEKESKKHENSQKGNGNPHSQKGNRKKKTLENYQKGNGNPHKRSERKSKKEMKTLSKEIDGVCRG